MSLLLQSFMLFVAALVLTGICRTVALRISLIDKPVARSAHSIPTPIGGGWLFSV